LTHHGPAVSSDPCHRHRLLLGQPALRNGQLRKIAENIYQDDAKVLLVNGKFLKEKFHSLAFVA